MKNIKLIAAALALLTVGALAFADEAADNYLSKFSTFVTSVEGYAKANDGSKAKTVAAQKKDIDALRQKVTLSTTQRFSDWLLTKRYEMAYSKIQKAETGSGEKNSAGEKIGSALNDAATKVEGGLKETGTKAVNSVKESVDNAATSVKEAAQAKVDEKVSETTNTITEKIQQGAQSITNALNNLLGGKKSED